MKTKNGKGAGLTTPPKVKNPCVLKKLAKDCDVGLLKMKSATGATGVSVKACLDYSRIPEFPSDFCTTLEAYLIKNPLAVNWLSVRGMQIEDIWLPQNLTPLSDETISTKNQQVDALPGYDVPEILNRMKWVSGSETDDELSLFLGTTSEVITAHRQNGVVPGDLLFETARVTETSLDWLATGKGAVAINNRTDSVKEAQGIDLGDARDIVGQTIGMIAFMDIALASMNQGENAGEKTDAVEFGMSTIFRHIQDRLQQLEVSLSGALQA